MDSCIPPKLSAEELRVIVSDAKNFALCNGLGLRPKQSPNDDLIEILPMTLFPSPFPKKDFLFAKSIQTSLNKMMHKISLDTAFLCEQLKQTVEVDDFTRNLLDVHLKVLKEGKAQTHSLGLFRSDYMLNEEPQLLRQIEVNAISVSFAGLSNKMSKLHRYLMSKYNSGFNLNEALPDFDTSSAMAKGLADAWDHYGKSSTVILVLVEDTVINICDQKAIEFSLYAMRPDIQVIRKKFSELPTVAQLKDNQLLIVDGKEVAVVYFRTGYSPDQYNRDLWSIRVMIEKSKAIKCPSIHYQLSGVKKIQQILTKREMLDKFLVDPKESEAVYSTFAKLWGFENNEEGDFAFDLAIKNPETYVLKPQREGGGNNFYGEEIVKVLRPLKNDKKREAYILMELIKPRSINNYTVRSSKEITLVTDKIVSELGICGAILGGENDIVFNCEAGYVLRSKSLGVNEGGISCGFGVLDTPFLF